MLKSWVTAVTVIAIAVWTLGFYAHMHGYQDEKGPRIKFDKESHDFGEVEDGSIVDYVFTLKNIGDEVLKIHRLKGS